MTAVLKKKEKRISVARVLTYPWENTKNSFAIGAKTDATVVRGPDMMDATGGMQSQEQHVLQVLLMADARVNVAHHIIAGTWT